VTVTTVVTRHSSAATFLPISIVQSTWNWTRSIYD